MPTPGRPFLRCLSAAAVAVVPLVATGCSSPESTDDERVGTVTGAATGAFGEVTGFGANPGALKMFAYVPATLAPSPAIVVVLHGCTEAAASAAKTGWNELADQHGFVVVYPEQATANNPLRCFNWAGEYGDATNLKRGQGENQSIKSMVDKALADHGGDPRKVYAVGFSAGGAEAAVVAAVWPDVFAAAATIAGIPFHCTTVYAEVSGCQKPGKDLTPEAWGKRVRDAHPGYAGPYPRMSIWQGDGDLVVGTANRAELVDQWTHVHGVDVAAPAVNDTVDGFPHAAWKDATGAVVVESFTITGMGHAVPVVPAKQCGTVGQYGVDEGICAAAHIAAFFGLPGGGTPGGGSPADGGGTTSGGADAASSSSSSSASSASGGASGADGGGPTGTNATGDTGYGDVKSTCAFAPPGEATGALPFLALAAGALASRRRRQGR